MKTNFNIIAMLLCVVASMSFTSCSQDNEDMQKLIVGDWKFEEGKYFRNNVRFQMEDGYDSPFVFHILGDVIRFSEDGSYYRDGRALENWVLMDGKITFSYYNITYDIVELTKKKLILSYEADYDDSDFSEIITYKKI